MKRAVIILFQISFVVHQIIGCDYNRPKKYYTASVEIVDTFGNGKTIYAMMGRGFLFIDSTGKYKDGDTATVKQQITYQRKWSIGQ